MSRAPYVHLTTLFFSRIAPVEAARTLSKRFGEQRELREAKASIEETDVVDAYSRLVQLQTNFDAAMQVTSMQRYSGLFTRI